VIGLSETATNML